MRDAGRVEVALGLHDPWFVDLDAAGALYATPGRDAKVLTDFDDDLIRHGANPELEREIGVGMSPAFVKGASECLVRASVTFDKIHVIELADAVVDEVRWSDQ